MLADACGLDHADERLRTAIENRQLQIVQFNDGVVNSGAHKSRKHMLGCRDEHTFLHQAGGVAYFGDVAAGGFDLVVVEINPAENNAGTRGCGQDAQRDLRPTVQSYAFALH